MLLEKNRAHFAEHDIELLMTTVLQRYSIESIGHMSEAELNEWSYCIGKYLNDFQFKKVSLTEEETKLVLKEKNLMAKISGNMCEILLDFTAGSELDFNDECKIYINNIKDQNLKYVHVCSRHVNVNRYELAPLSHVHI